MCDRLCAVGPIGTKPCAVCPIGTKPCAVCPIEINPCVVTALGAMHCASGATGGNPFCVLLAALLLAFDLPLLPRRRPERVDGPEPSSSSSSSSMVAAFCDVFCDARTWMDESISRIAFCISIFVAVNSSFSSLAADTEASPADFCIFSALAPLAWAACTSDLACGADRVLMPMEGERTTLLLACTAEICH